MAEVGFAACESLTLHCKANLKGPASGRDELSPAELRSFLFRFESPAFTTSLGGFKARPLIATPSADSKFQKLW